MEISWFLCCSIKMKSFRINGPLFLLSHLRTTSMSKFTWCVSNRIGDITNYKLPRAFMKAAVHFFMLQLGSICSCLFSDKQSFVSLVMLFGLKHPSIHHYYFESQIKHGKQNSLNYFLIRILNIFKCANEDFLDFCLADSSDSFSESGEMLGHTNQRNLQQNSVHLY